MEIERKFLVTHPPAGYTAYPFLQIEQAYLCTEPVVRIRRQQDEYWLTYKSAGLLSREEYNLPLTKDAYEHLLPKADGIILKKKRYHIPIEATGLLIEFDIFEEGYQGLMLAEVEFPDEETAKAFVPPGWFDQDVTFSGEYQNSTLSKNRQARG